LSKIRSNMSIEAGENPFQKDMEAWPKLPKSPPIPRMKMRIPPRENEKRTAIFSRKHEIERIIRPGYMPRSEEVDALMLSDLLDVGLYKAIGYLPKAMIEYHGRSVQEIEAELCARGVTTMMIGDWLVACYEPALWKLLSENQELLLSSGWPVDAKEFTAKVFSDHVSSRENKPLYDFIGLCFADHRYIGDEGKEEYNPEHMNWR